MAYALDNDGNYVARLPGAFILDCIECECDVGEYANSGIWTGNQAQLEELVSRSRYYADPYGPDHATMRMAAKQLLKSLGEQGLYGTL